MSARRCIRLHPRCALALVTVLGLGAGDAVAAASATTAAPGPGRVVEGPAGPIELLDVSPALSSRLLKVALEAEVRIDAWPVAPGERRSVLVRRHDVYDRTARVVVAEGDRLVDVPRSPLVFFWGPVDGDSGGTVVLSVDPLNGSLEASTETALGSYRVSRNDEGTYTLARALATDPLACGVGCDEGAALAAAATRPPAPRPISVLHVASVAVDTDNELLSLKFANNPTAAINYLAQLFASMNVMFERDLLVRLLQGYTVLRPSTTPDPWTMGPTPSGPDVGRARQGQLDEFAAYWAANFPGVNRALATLLSGKQPDASTSGYSFVGVLCATQAAGGAYSFNQVYTAAARPAADDVRQVGHEIGHNFGTRHTHCLLPTPADECWSGEGTGCYSGPTTCPAPATYSGIPGVQGTVMSWCDRPHPGDPTWACPVTNVFHPATVAILQPRIDTAVGAGCVVPFASGTPPPTPMAISPAIGRIPGGTSVTINGTGFQNGATVGLADASAAAPLTSVVVVNSTTITGITSAHAAATVDVVVMNPDQQSSSLLAAFTYRPDPTVAAVTPNGGPASGGTQVTVTGTGFAAPATLTLGGSPATGVSVLDAKTITGVTASHSVGIVDVTVNLAGGLSGTLSNGFFYTPVMFPVAFYTVPPCRLVDTRAAAGPLAGPALAASAYRTFTFNGGCGIPAGAKAVSVNLTVVQPVSPGYLTLFPSDGIPPLASNLNFSPGQVRANNAVLVLATDGSGRLTVFNGSNGIVHFLLDVNGYFQ